MGLDVGSSAFWREVTMSEQRSGSLFCPLCVGQIRQETARKVQELQETVKGFPYHCSGFTIRAARFCLPNSLDRSQLYGSSGSASHRWINTTTLPPPAFNVRRMSDDDDFLGGALGQGAACAFDDSVCFFFGEIWLTGGEDLSEAKKKKRKRKRKKK